MQGISVQHSTVASWLFELEQKQKNIHFALNLISTYRYVVNVIGKCFHPEGKKKTSRKKCEYLFNNILTLCPSQNKITDCVFLM